MAEPRPSGLGLLLTVLSGTMLLAALEVSVVLPALPSVRAEFGLAEVAAQWLMSGFAAGFAAMLPAGPRLAARWGRRRVYLVAMLVFALASVLAGTTDSLAVLVASRILKGTCAALTAPAGLAIISTAFPDGPVRRRAVGVYSLFGAGGFTAGLLLSGALSSASWHWAFLFPAPVALVLLVVALRAVPPSPATAPPRLTAAVLRDGGLVRSAIGAATLNGSYIGLLLMVTSQLAATGMRPWQLALALLPASLPLAVAAPYGPRLVGRFGTARLIAAGALCDLAGAALYLARPAPLPYAMALLPTLLLVEGAFVLSFVALNVQATATVEPASRGVAVPLYQTFVQLGAAVSLPVVAVLFAGDGAGAAAVFITVVAAVGAGVALYGLRTARLLREATL